MIIQHDKNNTYRPILMVKSSYDEVVWLAQNYDDS